MAPPPGAPRVRVLDSDRELGAAAASDLIDVLRRSLYAQQQSSIILAAGRSQLPVFDALCEYGPEVVDWRRILVFHMDEYIGLGASHPACFRRFLREHFVDRLKPARFCDIRGDASDLSAEIERYSGLLGRHPTTASLMGIGENGHLAFNEPPADFEATRSMAIVELAAETKRQQANDGPFATPDKVPGQALSLTIPALLSSAHLLVVAFGARKAKAVQAALGGPVTPDCPASILRTCSHATVYLDREAAALL